MKNIKEFLLEAKTKEDAINTLLLFIPQNHINKCKSILENHIKNNNIKWFTVIGGKQWEDIINNEDYNYKELKDSGLKLNKKAYKEIVLDNKTIKEIQYDGNSDFIYPASNNESSDFYIKASNGKIKDYGNFLCFLYKDPLLDLYFIPNNTNYQVKTDF